MDPLSVHLETVKTSKRSLISSKGDMSMDDSAVLLTVVPEIIGLLGVKKSYFKDSLTIRLEQHSGNASEKRSPNLPRWSSTIKKAVAFKKAGP